MKQILIGGIGNVLLGDDGIGPFIVRTFSAHYECGTAVEVEDLGTPALELTDYLEGKDAVILVDSIAGDQPDDPPGSIRLFRKPDILACQVPVRTGPHAPSLIETLVSLELIGAAPEEVLLIGIVGQSYELGPALNPYVRLSVDPVIATMLKELARLHVNVKPKERPDPPHIWWEAASDS